MLAVLFEGCLGCPAPQDPPLQVPGRGARFDRAPAQRLLQLFEVGVGLARGAMSSLDGDDGVGEEDTRAADHPLSGFGCAGQRYQGRQGPLVNPRQIQRLQPEGHGLTSNSSGTPSRGFGAGHQVAAQRRSIVR